MESKMYVSLIIVLLFGVCLGVPLGKTNTTTVGINHWTHDDEDGFLYPTNETDDVSINNNSLLWANMSEYTSNDIFIDNDVFVINASALGNIFDQDLNTSDSPTFVSLTLNGNLDMATNDISNVNDIEVENDIQLNDKLEHLGDTDTYLDFNANQILFFAGGTEILDMITTLATFGVDLDLDNNALLNANLTEYTSSDIYLDDDKWYVNDTGGGTSEWNRTGNELFTRLGDNITINGTLDIIHTAIEMDDHALELVVDAGGFGDVKGLDIDYVTGAIATGQDEGIILINIDDIISTGGDIFALEVLATEGGAGIYGLKAGVGVGPIHHDSGTFTNPTTGTDNTASTDVPAMIDGDIETTTAIFENDNEYIIIGAAAAFEEMEFIMKTNSSNPGIKPTFWYSTAGAGQFTAFTPVDGTNGFRNTGVVAWDASDLTGHTTNDDTGTYDIKVIRTQNNLVTTPVLGYAKVAATTEYIWNKDGNLSVHTIIAENYNSLWAVGWNESYWNSDNGRLYTNTDGDDVQINNSLFLDNNTLLFANLTEYTSSEVFLDDDKLMTNETDPVFSVHDAFDFSWSLIDPLNNTVSNPFDQELNTTDDVTFNSVSGDGSGLTGVLLDWSDGDPFFNVSDPFDLTWAIMASYWNVSDGDPFFNLTDAPQYTHDLWDQANATENNPFDQELNTTDNVVFNDANGSKGDFSYLDVGNDVNITGRLHVDNITTYADDYINVSSNLTFIDNATINATDTLTLGNPGDILLGDDTLRTMRPETNASINLGSSSYKFNDLWVMKVYCSGVVDPPCVLFDKMSFGGILEMLDKQVPKDNPDQYEGMAVYYDGDEDAMFAVQPSTGHREEFVWKSDYDILEQRVAQLELLVHGLMENE